MRTVFLGFSAYWLFLCGEALSQTVVINDNVHFFATEGQFRIEVSAYAHPPEPCIGTSCFSSADYSYDNGVIHSTAIALDTISHFYIAEPGDVLRNGRRITSVF